VYGFLRQRAWVLGLLGAVVLAAGCVSLGLWQLDRRATRNAANALVERNYDAAPVPLAELLGSPGADFAPEATWRPVRARGRYDADATVVVRNRPRDGVPGYAVLVPLVTDDGDALLVERGWVPTGPTGQGPAAVPAPPAGEVEVLARLRPSEPPARGPAPAGQALRIDVPSIAADLPYAVYDAYAALERERPAATPAPLPPVRPAPDPGPHLSYSLQWFVFAALALGGYGWLARREAATRSGTAPARRRESADEAAEDAVVTAAARPVPGTPAARGPDGRDEPAASVLPSRDPSE
jgi:cytochrome oxidase assembly protein ShyY1